MSTIEIKPATPAAGPARRAVAPWVVPACLMAFGHLPLALLQARSLWVRPHLQGFPFALLGAAILARLAAGRLGPLRPGSPTGTATAAGLCWLTLAAAGLLAATWVGASAAMATLLVLAYGLGGWRLLGAVLPAWAFAALAFLPRGEVDWWLIARLQGLVTAWGSPLLDWLGVRHTAEGNLFKVAGHRLMVEQACSGVQSLYSVLGGTLFFVLWARRGPARSAILLGSAFGWVMLGNVARVVLVVYAQDRWGLDLIHGWRHDALGLAILGLTLGLTASTDQLLAFLASLTTIRLAPPLSNKERKMPPVAPAAPPPSPTIYPDPSGTLLGSRRAGAAFGLLGLAQVAWLWPLSADLFPDNRVVPALRALGEDDLPGRWGGFVRQGSGVEDRGPESAMGEFSRVWRYRSGSVAAVVAVDYPFLGWHDLPFCYQAIGWVLRDRAVRPGEAGPSVEATFEAPQLQQASLIFGLDDLEGRALDAGPPPRDRWGHLKDRLDLLGRSGWLGGRAAGPRPAAPACYQVQVLFADEAPLSPSRMEEQRAFFEHVRGTLRRRVARELGRPAAGGAR